MRINHYKTRQDENGIAILLREASHNYGGEVKLNDPRRVYEFCRDYLEMDRETEEYVYCLCFSSSNRLIGLFEISHGTCNSSVCNNREIFQKALLCNAVNIIITHNHPSGDPTPSREDINVCSKVREAGEVIGVKLIDSIIVGNQNYISLKEARIL